MKARIGCSRYNVKRSTRRFDTDCHGAMHPDKKEIVIYSEIPIETARQTLWHEITHALLFEIEREDLATDESFVNIFAKHIHSFLEDNDLQKLYKLIAD